MKSAPELVFLPIVTRELRVSARRPKMYFARMSLAAVWFLLGAFALMTVSNLSNGKVAGAQLFYCVSVGLLVWSVVCAWVGCDSISEEKREGTIGFLFLTDLKSHDIVLGKMAAAAIPAFYGALAALPMLAIFMLVGGVNASQYIKTGLAILNVFLLGQTVAMAASAVCRSRGNTMGFPLLIIIVYFMAFAAASLITEFRGWHWPAILFQHINPLRPFELALESSFAPVAAPGYWLSLLEGHLQAWVFLALAVWALPRRWRENPKRPSFWKTTWERWRYGNMARRTAFRRRLVSVNPFLWLMCRGRFSPAFLWSVMGTIMALIVFFAAKTIKLDGWRGNYAGFFVFLILALQLILRMGVPSHAGLLEQHRRTGSLEIILCCSPLSVDDILDGVWLTVRRYYRWPVLIVVALQIFMFFAALVTERQSPKMDLLIFIFVSAILLIADLRAAVWMAMWTAMSAPKPRSAGPTTLFWISMFPWCLVAVCDCVGLCRSEFSVWILWPAFALVNDTIISRFASSRLRKNFRLWAVPSSDKETVGFLGRLGRELGLLRRRRKKT